MGGGAGVASGGGDAGFAGTAPGRWFAGSVTTARGAELLATTTRRGMSGAVADGAGTGVAMAW